MTNASSQTEKLSRPGALVGGVKAAIARFVARFSGANDLRGMNRAEFEQIARDLNLQPLSFTGF